MQNFFNKALVVSCIVMELYASDPSPRPRAKWLADGRVVREYHSGGRVFSSFAEWENAQMLSSASNLSPLTDSMYGVSPEDLVGILQQYTSEENAESSFLLVPCNTPLDDLAITPHTQQVALEVSAPLMFEEGRERTKLIDSAYVAFKNLATLATTSKEELEEQAEIIEYRKEAVRAFAQQYPGFLIDRTQICPVTGEIFDRATGKTVKENVPSVSSDMYFDYFKRD